MTVTPCSEIKVPESLSTLQAGTEVCRENWNETCSDQTGPSAVNNPEVLDKHNQQTGPGK